MSTTTSDASATAIIQIVRNMWTMRANKLEAAKSGNQVQVTSAPVHQTNKVMTDAQNHKTEISEMGAKGNAAMKQSDKRTISKVDNDKIITENSRPVPENIKVDDTISKHSVKSKMDDTSYIKELGTTQPMTLMQSNKENIMVQKENKHIEKSNNDLETPDKMTTTSSTLHRSPSIERSKAIADNKSIDSENNNNKKEIKRSGPVAIATSSIKRQLHKQTDDTTLDVLIDKDYKIPKKNSLSDTTTPTRTRKRPLDDTNHDKRDKIDSHEDGKDDFLHTIPKRRTLTQKTEETTRTPIVLHRKASTTSIKADIPQDTSIRKRHSDEKRKTLSYTTKQNTRAAPINRTSRKHAPVDDTMKDDEESIYDNEQEYLP